MAGVRRPGNAAVALLALLATLVMSACSSGSDAADKAEPVTVGLLLPDGAERYELVDKPAFEARVTRLCTRCDVRYANAGGSTDAQLRQAEAMLADGVDVLVLAPVDPVASAAAVDAAAGRQVPVVSYDRLTQGPVSGYVTFGTAPTGGASAAPAAAGEPVTTPGDRAAQLAALRDVLAGNRPDTTYLPYRAAAEATAEMALAHARGAAYDRYNSLDGATGSVPTQLVSPVTVTREDLRAKVVEDGRFTADELCAPPLADACRSAGLT